MKLTKENIKFIDNYLKNSQVEYFDIRMEMVDHISSAIEEKMQIENLDFYETFKNYMLENKKELLIRNEKFMKWSFSNILPFLKFCIKPITLLIVLLFVGIVSFFKNSFENINTSEYILILSSLFLILVLIQFYMYRFVIKDRL